MQSRYSFFRIFLFLTLTGTACKMYGQQTMRDSLSSRLALENNPVKRVDLLNTLSFEHFDINDSLATYFAREALALSQTVAYPKGFKYARLLVGIGFYSEGEFDKAIDLFRKAMEVKADSGEYYDLYAMALTGECQTVIARYDSAINTFNAGLALAKKSESFWLPRMYYGLAKTYIKKWDNQKALIYLDSARALLDENEPDFRAIELFTVYGELYRQLAQREKSFESFEKMCAIAEKIGDRYHLIKCAVNQADHHYDQANYAEALKFAQSALEQSKLYSYPHQQVLLYLKIGEIYKEMSEYDRALNYFFQALSISEKVGLLHETAQIYRRVAWVYKDEGKYDLALRFTDKSLEITRLINDTFGTASGYNIRGLVSMRQQKYEQAISEHTMALGLRTSIHDVLGEIASLYNLALVYEQQGFLEKALDQQLKVLSLAEPVSNNHGLSLSYLQVARLLMALKRYDEAEQYLEKSVQASRLSPTRRSRRNSYLLYAELAEVRKDLATALGYRKKYEALTDSIFSEESAASIAEFQASYELEKKEDEINVLRTQRELQENQLQLQNIKIQNQTRQIYAAGIFLAIISILLVLLIRLNRKLRETQKRLADANTQLSAANASILDVNKNLESIVDQRTSQLRKAYVELDTFFYRSSHDFRRPLTTLIGLADVSRITVRDKQAAELFDMVRSTAQSLDKMLHKLQSISDLGAMEISYKNVLLKPLIRGSLEKHMPDIEEHGIEVIEDIQVAEPITSYPVLISIILENLIENAITFSQQQNPTITVRAFVQNNTSVTIEVEDNGHGIAEKYMPLIFDMYYKASEKSKGNGLGLYIVAKAVEKLGGTIKVETIFTRGSKFIVDIPDCLS